MLSVLLNSLSTNSAVLAQVQIVAFNWDLAVTLVWRLWEILRVKKIRTLTKFTLEKKEAKNIRKLETVDFILFTYHKT